MKKILTFISVLTVLAGLSACNKDVSSDQEVAELKSMLLDENGKIIFDLDDATGLYVLGVESRADATDLATLYAGSGFKGENYTRNLSDNKGSIKVTKETNGVFYTIRFKVESIPAFTLDICDANGDNAPISWGDSGTYHKCGVCHKSWKSASNVCPWTSQHKK